jgi:hypothetical protein
MSRGGFGLQYGSGEGMFFPLIPACDPVPFNTNPPDPLLAIATDLLAQVEAQHRSATRLEHSVRQLSSAARDRSISALMPVHQIRDQVQRLRDLFEAERALLDEFERQLTGVNK